jgi:hypothetical protein
MSEKSILRKNWKLLLNVISIAALVLLVYITRHQIGSTIENLANINGWALLLIIPIEVINYHAQAKMYQKLFLVVGNKFKYRYLYAASLELNLVNHLFPSGGVTGISYFGVKISGSKNNVSGGKATLIQLMKVVLVLISFEVLLIIGVFSLAIVGRVNELIILVSTALSTLLVVLTILAGYVVGSRQRINNFFGSLTKGLNWLIHKTLRKNPETINMIRARVIFDDFHNNYQQIVKHWRQLGQPFFYALLANFTEIMAVYVVFLAFGEVVNIGAVILAYGVANFAGLVSVLPGGVGIYEALMVAVLAVAGVPAKVSIPAIIMYRVVNTIIQLPPGYYFYHRSLNSARANS